MAGSTLSKLEFHEMLRSKMTTREQLEAFDNVFVGYVAAQMGNKEFSEAAARAYHEGYRVGRIRTAVDPAP